MFFCRNDRINTVKFKKRNDTFVCTVQNIFISGHACMFAPIFTTSSSVLLARQFPAAAQKHQLCPKNDPSSLAFAFLRDLPSCKRRLHQQPEDRLGG